MLTGQPLPLSGLTVLDLTTIIYGPYTTQMLGDFGADVIKVEAPGGDTTRAIGPARHPGMSALFMGSNRNKRSIVLDLKREAARRALWRLIDGADLFVHNMRPRKIAALGFDPDAVLARKPGIVYGGLHGYREAGPYGDRPAYDDVIQGQSGLAGTFWARDGEPVLVPSVVADKTAALLATSGLLAALIQRMATGKGVYVETSMFEGLAAYTLLEHQEGAAFLPAEGPMGYGRALAPNRRAHRTADGYICMVAYTDKHWRAFWALAGRPEVAEDPRFAVIGERARHIDTLYRLTGEALATKTTADWLACLEAAEIPAGPVNRLEDLREDRHLRAIDFFKPYDHPTEGRLEVVDTAFQFDRESLPLRRHHPGLGEHGRDLLAEAGLTEAEIDAALNPDEENDP